MAVCIPTWMILPMDNWDLSKNEKNLLNSENGCLYTDLDDSVLDIDFLTRKGMLNVLHVFVVI